MRLNSFPIHSPLKVFILWRASNNLQIFLESCNISLNDQQSVSFEKKAAIQVMMWNFTRQKVLVPIKQEIEEKKKLKLKMNGTRVCCLTSMMDSYRFFKFHFQIIGQSHLFQGGFAISNHYYLLFAFDQDETDFEHHM